MGWPCNGLAAPQQVPRSAMWLRCCCCCGTDKEEKFDDSSSLVAQERQTQEHGFYVPRRHSSFQPSTCHPTFVQLEHPHSDCSTSSDEERAPPEQRGRCWSILPGLDVATLTSSRRGLGQGTHGRSTPDGRFVFDRHVLGEISEGDREKEPSGHAADICGHLTLTTRYEEREQRLTVFLERVTGLPKKGDEPFGTFVKLSITSSGKTFRLSRAVKKTFDPVYQEEHVFHTSRSKWKSGHSIACLRLSVFDCDRRGRHDAIGHALLPLAEIGADKQQHRLPLTPMSVPIKNLGQILVGLLYVPTQSRLTVHVIKARRLRLDEEGHKRFLRPLSRDLTDSFCKVTLTCGGQKIKTYRSGSAAGPDPFFNFRSSFVVPPQYVRDACAVVSVVARSTLGRAGATLGRVTVLGPYVEMADGSATQWGRMILEGRSVVQWRNIYL